MAEASADRLARLLLLVPWLTAHSGISKQDAAHHFGISVRQLERDLELVTVTGPGLYGGELVDIAFDDETVTVYDHQGLTHPVELTTDEAAALLLGLHALQQLPDIDPALVAGVIDKLARYAGAHQDLDVRIQASPHAAVISRALAEGRDLDIAYLHPLRDDITERRVTPLGIITRDGTDYLNAWCHRAEAFRTFRLDRMQRCEAGEPSQPLPTEEQTTAVREGEQALVELPADAAHLLEHVSCSIVERGLHVRALVRFSDVRWLSAWVRQHSPRIRVLEPEAVAATVRAHAEQALAAYRQP